jgi:asparagine synthase (glutamine-hydrolysing)
LTLSVMAGIAGQGGLTANSIDSMAVPGLCVAAKAENLLAQGSARLENGPGENRRLVDGTLEQAVADIGRDSVTLRRDAVGVRPLYFACSADGRSLAWASRLTQLVNLEWVDTSIDWDGLLDIVAAAPRFDPAATCVAGIRQVPPGHRLEWRPGRMTVVREWEPERFVWEGGRGPDRPAEEFAERLETAVRRRLDGGAAILLSGGLDSTAVAAAAVRAGVRPRALSSVFPRFPSVDETPRILAVRAALGLDGDLVEVRDGGIADLDAELALHGEPHVAPNHSHMSALLGEAAARRRMVVLDGHDGDGALGPLSGLGSLVLGRPRLARQALAYLASGGRSRRTTLKVWAAECLPSPARRALRAGLLPWRRRSSPLAWAGVEILERARQPVERGNRWRQSQLEAVGPRLARGVTLIDRMGASAGVEVRHPFADRELLEFLLSLPPEVKHAGGRWKALVRDGFPELPGEVRDLRTKTIFDPAVAAAHPLEQIAPLLCDPEVSVPGVDYEALRDRLASRRPYVVGELSLMRRLALAHLFLGSSR